MSKKKLIIGAAVAIVAGAIYFVFQTENYMGANDTWRIEATKMVNTNTANILTIGEYLQSQAASTTKK